MAPRRDRSHELVRDGVQGRAIERRIEQACSQGRGQAMLRPVFASSHVSEVSVWRPGRHVRALLSTSLLVALCWLPRSASAFERQWHVGAGLGVLVPSRVYGAGGAAALHAAYGLSDVFDARLALTGSLHEPDDDNEKRTSLGLATLGLAYKLDIIEWVPYFGVRAGGYYFTQAPPASKPDVETYSRGGGAVGAMAGVDYSFSRSFAVGAELSYDELLPEGHVSGAFLRAEYRWGF